MSSEKKKPKLDQLVNSEMYNQCPEQDAQIHRRHKWQWCLRRRHPKLRPHLIQERPRFSFSFFLLFPLVLNETLITFKLLQLARKVPSRSSDGRKGRACKDQRMWFVDAEEVKVELVLVRATQIIESWLRRSQKNHNFSCGWNGYQILYIYIYNTIDFLPACTTKLPSGLNTSNLPLPEEWNQQPPYSAEVEVEHDNAICVNLTSAMKLGMILPQDSNHHLSTKISQLHFCFLS